MNLYDIQNEILSCCIDTETGEIIDADRLDELQMEKKTKIRNIACWIKNLKAEAAAYKAVKDAFAERQFEIGWRKSTAVNVVDEDKLPKAYLIQQQPKVDKRALLEDLKDGLEIAGATLVERNNMSIR